MARELSETWVDDLACGIVWGQVSAWARNMCANLAGRINADGGGCPTIYADEILDHVGGDDRSAILARARKYEPDEEKWAGPFASSALG